jgi:hypothetical protein
VGKEAVDLVMQFMISVSRIVMRRSNLLFGALLVMVLVLTGPFETHLSIDAWSLPLYWGVIVFGGKFAAIALRLLMRRRDFDPAPFEGIVLSALWMGLVYAPPAYLWTWLMVTPMDGTLMAFHWFVLNVLFISFFIFVAREIILHHMLAESFARAEGGSIPARAEAAATVPRLMKRICPKDPGPILRIEALDHFVSVVTAQDTYHLRLRFSDAVAEMDGAPGLVIHRSHWVRREHIAGTEREGGRMLLRLSCGTRVPVSRKYRPHVEASLSTRNHVEDEILA